MSPRILVVGAGAVGAYVGGYLARDGADVTLADPWPEHVEHMNAHGLTLEGTTPEECFTTPVRALHLTELQGLVREGPVDIAIVSVKSYDTTWATALAREYLAADGYVLSLQNGINEERIADVVGWGRILGCIASKIVVELTGPGQVSRRVPKGGAEHTVFRVGEPHGRITARAQAMADRLASVDSSKATTNLWGERWSKLVQNAMGNGVSAATGLSVKQYTQEQVTRRLSIRLAGEAVRTGQALGYELEKIGGQPPEIWPEAAAEIERGANDAPLLRELEAHMLAGAERMRDEARPSMGQDIQKGRRTEIEYLNGLVALEAARLGQQTPANSGLVRAVQQVERGRAAPGLDMVREI